jgi:hypothetical protein
VGGALDLLARGGLPGEKGVSYSGGFQRVTLADAEPERPGGNRSETEDRQPNRPDIRCVAMQPPDHHSCQAGCLSLQGHQIAGACLIQPPAIVSYQDVARRRRFERLQEDIDAASMPGRARTPGQPATGHHRTQERRCATHRELSAYASVGQVGGRQGREPALHSVMVHEVFLLLQSRERRCYAARPTFPLGGPPPGQGHAAAVHHGELVE